MKSMKLTPKRMAVIGITASIYVVLTLFLPFPAYGEIQFRFSEVLNLLAFINPIFAPGIIIGCFIANLFSPMILDCIVGTLATAITMLCITKFSKNLFIASLYPTVFCVFIGAMITFTGVEWTFTNFLIITASIMAGEFVVMTFVGYPIFRQLMKNQKLIMILKEI